MTTIFDHIAIATKKISDAPETIVGTLGGVSGFGGPSGDFRWWHWDFDKGGRIEIIEPDGPPGGFVHRFLDRLGPGIHHVNFETESLKDSAAKAERLGYNVVGYDDTHEYWKEAFLHPKTAMNIVVQLVETGGPEFEHGEWDHPQADPPAEPAERPPAVTIVGLRMQTPNRDNALRLWNELLGGEVSESASEIVFRWPGSPMRVAVDVRDGVDEGPTAIEVYAERDLSLPDGPHPKLGTTFMRIAE